MKSNRGVSVIELVLVIIILVIIATFSIFSGKNTVNQTTATEIYTEINSMRDIVSGINIKKFLDENFALKPGEQYDVKVSELNIAEEDFEKEYEINIKSGDYEKLYLIYGMDNQEKYTTSKVRDVYGLDSIKHTYLVNFEEGTVVLLESITIDKKKVRTYEQIRALLDNGEV